MAENEAEREQRSSRTKLPAWSGYVIAVMLQVVSTWFLITVAHGFEPDRFPLPYNIAVMIIAYFFGEGPCIVALVVGVMAFGYYFLPPVAVIVANPSSVKNLECLIELLVGSVLFGLAGCLMRRSRLQVQRLADELERQTALMDTLIQNIPLGIGFTDRETRHVIANSTLAEMNRTTVDGILGKTVWEALTPDRAAAAAEDIQKIFATGEPSTWTDVTLDMDGDRHFDVQHIPVRTRDGEIIGIGIVVVETTERVRARKELERLYAHEHRVAEALQSAILGEVPERMDGFGFETLYRAALEEARVGGDFYDVFRIDDDRIGIAIGDVSGKGLKAAVQVAMAKYSLRSRAYEGIGPAEALQRVNSALLRDMDAESFVTLFYGVLDCSAKTVTYTNAGHWPAMLWSAADRQAASLQPTGPLVGTLQVAAYEERTCELHPGDEMLLGTDGLFEVRCGAEFLGIEGLIDLYAELKRSGMASAGQLVERVIEFCGGDLRDDLAVLRVSVP